MGADGEAIAEPVPDAVAAAVEQVRASGTDACAVCLLFAFRNPAHENRIAAALRAALPGLPVCTSFEVQPEFREYERFSTTVLNAYLQPVLGRYLTTLEEALADVAPGASIGINQSSGGLMSPARARALPVRTALSGPAAGAVGAAHVAKRAGAPRRRDSGDPRGVHGTPGAAHSTKPSGSAETSDSAETSGSAETSDSAKPSGSAKPSDSTQPSGSAETSGRRNVITLDMGGTSADVALIRDFRADISFERDVAGFPVRLPSVDVETVGAGGGSVAWFDRDGLLKVGPASAGADPGPACYGRGGGQPTVTDANLALGRLPARGLLAGEMRLDASLARAAIAPIADRLGFGVERTARGMLDVVVANMVRAIRTISVERGYDPREFTLMAFGGAGPLHARDVAAALGMREILVPAAPGILCAQGLIVSDLKEDFVAGDRIPGDAAGLRRLAEHVEALGGRARAWFDAERIPAGSRRVELAVDARYVGQNFELAVPLAAEGDRGHDHLAIPRGGIADAPTMAADGSGTGVLHTSSGDGNGDGEGAMAAPSPEALRARFLEVHESAYGYANPHDPIEIVNVRLTARGRLGQPPAPPSPGDPGPLPEPFERRPVWFDGGSAGAPPTGDAGDGAMRDAGESAAGGIEGDAMGDVRDSTAGSIGENAMGDAAECTGSGGAEHAPGSAAGHIEAGAAGSAGAGIVNGAVDCPVYDRRSLRAGHTLDGPAIIEQLDSTTPIFPGDQAVVDPAGNLVIRIRGGAITGP